MDCHTFFGNGAYYGPDLTKAWLDAAWSQIWMPMTGTYLKWMSAIDANGFPAHFGHIQTQN